MRRLSMACGLCMMYLSLPTELPKAAALHSLRRVRSHRLDHTCPLRVGDPCKKPALEPLLCRDTVRIQLWEKPCGCDDASAARSCLCGLACALNVAIDLGRL